MSAEKRGARIQTSSIITVISISLVLFLVGLLGMLVISAKKVSDHLKENIGFHVYLNENAKEEESEKLQHFLEASVYVRSCRYLSKDSAAAIYQEEVGEDFVEFIGYNPLPASFEVQLKADYANPDSIRWIKKQITEHSVVKEFDYQESMVNIVNKNINRIALVLAVLISVLLLIALGLINNTIRLAIYSKRFLIRTMQLVGATGGFIKKPFLLKGLLNGLLAGILSNIILFSFVYALVQKVPDLQAVIDAKLTIYMCGAVLLLGILISGVSTWLAVHKYLRISPRDLY